MIMLYFQILNERGLFFNHSVKTQGNEPKFIFFYDLSTSLFTNLVDSITNTLNIFQMLS